MFGKQVRATNAKLGTLPSKSFEEEQSAIGIYRVQHPRVFFPKYLCKTIIRTSKEKKRTNYRRRQIKYFFPFTFAIIFVISYLHPYTSSDKNLKAWTSGARAYSKRSWLNGFSTDFQPWMEGLRGRFLQKRDTALLYARSPFAIPRAQEIAILSQISTSASLVEIRETWTRKAYGSSLLLFPSRYDESIDRINFLLFRSTEIVRSTFQRIVEKKKKEREWTVSE